VEKRLSKGRKLYEKTIKTIPNLSSLCFKLVKLRCRFDGTCFPKRKFHLKKKKKSIYETCFKVPFHLKYTGLVQFSFKDRFSALK
jgi:hypothetical protein